MALGIFTSISKNNCQIYEVYGSTVYIYIYISSWIFETVPQKGLEYSHRNLASPVSGDCGENFHRGLAVLVGLIVRLSPWATLPWAREGPPCQSLRGKGAAKAWYGPLVSLDNQLADHVSAVSLSFQTSFNVSGRLANERVPPHPRARLGGRIRSVCGGRGWCGLELSA